MFRTIALAFCALMIAGPAMARPFVNEETGFAVTIPDEFMSFDMGLQDRMLVEMSSFEMNDFGEGKYQCAASIVEPPFVSTRSQKEIIVAMVSAERQKLLAQSMGERYTIKSQTVFDNSGFTGTEFIVRLKNADATTPYVYIAMMETASGRTTLSCSAQPEDLDAALVIYRQIRASMLPATR